MASRVSERNKSTIFDSRSSSASSDGITGALNHLLDSGLKVRDLYKSLEGSRSGGITVEDLVAGLARKYNQEVSMAQANAAFMQYDANNDGLLSFGEFVQMLQGSAPVEAAPVKATRPPAFVHEPLPAPAAAAPRVNRSSSITYDDAPPAASGPSSVVSPWDRPADPPRAGRRPPPTGPITAIARAAPVGDVISVENALGNVFDSGRKMRDVFKQLDPTNSGSISSEELAGGLKAKFGYDVSIADADRMISVYSSDGDRRLKFKDFVRFTQCQVERNGAGMM